MAKRTVRAIALLTAHIAGLAWFFDFAYADWLRFSSPKSPNYATGQIVFEKAVLGVFYVTPSQHWWTVTILIPIWLTGAAGAAAYLAMTDRSKLRIPQANLFKTILQGSWDEKLLATLGVTWGAAMFTLFFFGDYVMALIFTGTLNVPPTAH